MHCWFSTTSINDMHFQLLVNDESTTFWPVTNAKPISRVYFVLTGEYFPSRVDYKWPPFIHDIQLWRRLVDNWDSEWRRRQHRSRRNTSSSRLFIWKPILTSLDPIQVQWRSNGTCLYVAKTCKMSL